MAENIRTKDVKFNCIKCKKSFTEVFEIECCHKFCTKCLSKSKIGRNFKCNVCGRFTDRPAKRISNHFDVIELDSTKAAIEKAKELAHKYKQIMMKRKEECSNQVKQLEKSMKGLKDLEKLKLKQVADLYNMRLSQLQKHFERLNGNVKAKIKTRESQLTKIVKDLRENIDDIHTDITQMTSNFEAMFEKKTERINERYLIELERKTKHRVVTELEIPEICAEVRHSGEFHLTDSLDISAPEPKLHTKNIKTDDTDLSELFNKVLTLNKEVESEQDILSLRLIGTEVCLNKGMNGFSLYSKELEIQTSREAGEMKYVYDVSGMRDGSLVVAATVGLFHVSKQGEVIHTFALGRYTSAATRRGVIYAAHSFSKSDPPCKIHTFQEDKEAKKELTTLPCTSGDYITLAIGNDVLFVSCSEESVITVVSIATGDHLKKMSRALGVFDLQNPEISQTDEENRLLIYEGNNRIHVMSDSDESFEVNLEKAIDKPAGVAYIDRRFFVATADKTLRCFVCPD